MLDSNQRFPAPKAGGMNLTILISVIWSGWRESNPQLVLGKDMCYH